VGDRLDPLDECLRCYQLLTAAERVAFLAAIAAPARPREPETEGEVPGAAALSGIPRATFSKRNAAGATAARRAVTSKDPGAFALPERGEEHGS
jgi:hypothetical protein